MKSLSDPLLRTPTVEPIPTEPPATSTEQQAKPAGAAPLVLAFRTMRPSVAVALTMPAVLGLMLGWWENGRSPWLWLGFIGGSILLAALAYQGFAAVCDFRQSQSPAAKPTTDASETTVTLFAAGVVSPLFLLNLGLLFLAIALLCVLWLALLAGWPVLFFSGLSFVLLTASLAPPVRLAYRGWGIGELAVAVGFGFLPLLGAYYIQTQDLTWLPVAVGLPLMLLIYLLGLGQNLGALRRDWLIGKRTLPVLLGSARALDLCIAVTVAAYISMLLVPVLFRLPIWLLAGMVTLPMVMGVFGEIRRSNVTPDDGYRVYDAAVKAAIWTGMLSSLAFWFGRVG